MLKIKNMNLNNVIRQGDSQPREYQLDTGNLNLNFANKQATIRLMTGDYRGIAYETTATVSSENRISFSIDDVIPAREYRLEITVDDYVFPSRALDGQFNVDPSSHGQEVNIIQVIGKDEIVREVKEQIEPFLGEVEQAELDRQAQEEARDTAEGERQEEYQKYGQQFTDVITELSEEKDYHSLPEIAGARGGFDTLGDRLNETTAQLAQKANEKEVVKKGKGTLSDFDEPTRATIQGLEPGEINAVLGFKNVQEENLADNVVSAEKTTFIETSTNLFNKDDIKKGYVFPSSGSPEFEVPNEPFSVSGYFSVSPSTNYQMFNVSRINYYDEAKTFISSNPYPVGVQSSITTPQNARYARVSVETIRLSTVQINKGDELLPYSEYEQTLKKVKVDASDILNLDIKVDLPDLEFIEVSSTNLLNKLNSEPDKSFDNVTGNVINSNGHMLSSYIPVVGGDTYSMNLIVKIAIYDENKNYIGARYLTNGKITFGPSVRFARVVFNKSDLEKNVQVNKGDSLAPHDEYALNIDGLRVVNQPKVDPLVAIRTGDRYVVNGKLDGVYTSPQVPGLLDDLRNMQVSELIALYDDLVARYPQYVVKSIWGQDSLGMNIYKYAFKPTPVSVDSYKTNFPKMILVAGVHGSEKAGVYALYQSMKQICELWGSDESLETLRWNVHFEVIPVVNNYGFNNYTRKNENGVDIARNFQQGWVRSDDPTHYTYGGTAPLTEQGSILIKQLIDANRDAIYFGSFHNFTTPVDDKDFIWNAGATRLQTNLAKNLISRLSRKWKKEYEWLPQDESTYFGYSNTAAPGGSESMQAMSAGIQGGTFEVCESFALETNSTSFNTLALTLGAEALLNWLVLVLKNNAEYYNK